MMMLRFSNSPPCSTKARLLIRWPGMLMMVSDHTYRGRCFDVERGREGRRNIPIWWWAVVPRTAINPPTLCHIITLSKWHVIIVIKSTASRQVTPAPTAAQSDEIITLKKGSSFIIRAMHKHIFLYSSGFYILYTWRSSTSPLISGHWCLIWELKAPLGVVVNHSPQ